MTRAGLTAVALATALVAPAGAGARIIDRIVAVVNDEIITWSELEDAVGPTLRQVETIPDPVTRAQQRDKQLRLGLDDLVGQRLVNQEAARRKLSVPPEEIDAHVNRVKEQQRWTDDQLRAYLAAQGITLAEFRRQTRDQLLRTKVIRGVLGDRIRVSDRDVEEYYKDRLTEAGSEVELEAAHIAFVVPPEASPAEEAAILQQAREVLARARAGEDFGALARQYSQAAGAEQGGLLGAIRRGSLDPAFEEVAFALPDGEVGGPVRSRLGYHVVKAIGRRRLPTPPLDQVREDLRRDLVDRRMREEVTRWVDELKKKAFVEVRL